MPTTNIHLFHIAGRALTESDLRVGLLAEHPSGAGGFITVKCVLVNDEFARFVSVQKGWEHVLVPDIQFNQPDLTEDEFRLLVDAMRAFDRFDAFPTDEQRSLVYKAATLGYVSIFSYTQVSWLQKAMPRIKRQRAA